MNPSPRSAIPIALAMGAVLLGAIALAAVTRPIDRGALPRDPADVRIELVAMHAGSGNCIRWGAPAPFGPADAHRVRRLLESAGFHSDLHTVLPLMSSIRLANAEHAKAHHAHSESQEFQHAALAQLGRFDRFRIEAGRHLPDELLPALQAFEEQSARHRRDAARREAFLSTLPPSHTAAFESLVEELRAALGHPSTQAKTVDLLADDISGRRLDALQGLLQAHRRKNGRYPASFHNLLRAAQSRVPDTIRRGIERDGSLRDGWLRPFEYYRVGQNSYRLRSMGSAPDTDEDDLVRSP